MPDSILVKHAIILFSLNYFKSISISKNEVCNTWLARQWRVKRFLTQGVKVFDQLSTVLWRDVPKLRYLLLVNGIYFAALSPTHL